MTIPAFVRVDAAAFFTVSTRFQAQLNIENLLDADYYASAHNNFNIVPGSPAMARVTLTTRF